MAKAPSSNSAALNQDPQAIARLQVNFPEEQGISVIEIDLFAPLAISTSANTTWPLPPK